MRRKTWVLLALLGCGGSSVETLSTQVKADDFGASALAADEGNAYAISSGGALIRIPLDGGAVVTLLPDVGSAFRLKVDATHVYWANGSANALPLDGGVPQSWPPSQGWGVQDIAPSGDNDLFFAENLVPGNSGLARGVLDQPNVAVNAVANLTGVIFNFEADHDSLYWFSTSGLFERNNLDPTGEPITQLSAQANALALSQTRVVWSELPPDGGLEEIHAIAKDGGTETVLASGVGTVRAMATDQGYVYLRTSFPYCIERVPLAGGAVQQLAKTGSDGYSLAVSGDSVLWLDSPGQLMRLRKAEFPSGGNPCSP